MQLLIRALLPLLLAASSLAWAQSPLIVLETSLPTASYAGFALAKDATSFAPTSAENKGLIEKGFGTPVAVKRTQAAHVQAHSPSTRLLLPIPFGWRGFDDGTRTRLFTPAGNIGMVLNALPMDGFETWDDTREQVWKLARKTAEGRAAKDPRYQARLIRLPSGTFGMREMNIYEGEDEPYSSVILFRQHPDDPRTAIRMNLFAPIGEFERHLGLAGLVMRDIEGATASPVGLDRDLSKIPSLGTEAEPGETKRGTRKP